MSADTIAVPAVDVPTIRVRRWRRWVVLALVVAVIGFGARAWLHHTQDVRTGTTAVSAAEFAARTGAKVTLIGVTAEGGMIEFRYQVTDPDKASLLLHQADHRPILVAEDTGATLAMTSRPHIHRSDLKLGGSYFFLLANVRNAVRDGTPVTVIVGDVRLEHLRAQS